MNKQQKEAYNTTLKVFLQETNGKFTPERMEEIIKELHRYETTLHRYVEIESNRNLTPAEEEKQTRLTLTVNEIAKTLGFGFRRNDDPRGSTLCFRVPSGNYNNWDSWSWRLNW